MIERRQSRRERRGGGERSLKREGKHMLSTACLFFAGSFVAEVEIEVKKKTGKEREKERERERGRRDPSSNFLPSF